MSGVLQLNDTKTIALPVVEAARGSLVIGNALHIVSTGIVLDAIHGGREAKTAEKNREPIGRAMT